MPTIYWYTMSSNCTKIVSIRKVKALKNQCKSSICTWRTISFWKRIPTCLKCRGMFYSLLKYHLTRDNSFVLIRACGKEVYKIDKSKELTFEPLKLQGSTFFEWLPSSFLCTKYNWRYCLRKQSHSSKNMIVISCKCRCNVVWKNGSWTMPWIWYETPFVRTNEVWTN